MPATPTAKKAAKAARPAPPIPEPELVEDPDDLEDDEDLDGDDYDDADENGDEEIEDEPEFASATRPVGRQAKVFEATFAPKKPYPFRIKAWIVDPETGEVSIDDDGEPEYEMHEFTAKGNPGAGGMIAMGSLVRVDPHGRTMADAAAIMVFFERVLVPKDWGRFYELIVDRTDQQVQMEDLGAVYSWLIEEYGGRPTRPSSPSSNGRSRRGRSSKARRR